MRWAGAEKDYFFQALQKRAELFAAAHDASYEIHGPSTDRWHIHFRYYGIDATVTVVTSREKNSGDFARFAVVKVVDPVLSSISDELLPTLRRLATHLMLVKEGGHFIGYARFVVAVGETPLFDDFFADLILDAIFFGNRAYRFGLLTLTEPSFDRSQLTLETSNRWTPASLEPVSRRLAEKYNLWMEPDGLRVQFALPDGRTSDAVRALLRFVPYVHPAVGAGCLVQLYFPKIVVPAEEQAKVQQLNQLEFETLFLTSVSGTWRRSKPPTCCASINSFMGAAFPRPSSPT